MTMLHFKKSIDRSLSWRCGFVLITLALLCFGLSPTAKALLPAPPPDGGYPGGNTAEGTGASRDLTTGTFNTAVGNFSLTLNTEGAFNTGVGNSALRNSTTGDNNTACGSEALLSNTEGSGNTAVGVGALEKNTTGFGNTGIGTTALQSNRDSVGNTAVGSGALINSNPSVSFGFNTAIGLGAGENVTTASGVTAIGANMKAKNVSLSTWVANIYGKTTQNGMTLPVIVSADGQLGTMASSERFKKDIATMNEASEAILSLRPVTFHYKTDSKGTPQFGLIAEEVAKVNPALVLPDNEGKPYTVRYEQVNAMLLNEFLKEHRTVQGLKASAAKQEANTAKQEATIARQQKQIEALTAGLQKVSAQVEMSRRAPQSVANNQ